MGALKFEIANFFDAENGTWVEISPANFNEEIHGGRIECPCTDCHGSLSYVPNHHTRGSLTYRPDHFRTNGHGEPHSHGCLLSPEPAAKTTLRMQEALEAGKFILLNINFSTSFDLEKGRLKDKFARAAMEKWEGRLRKEWILENGKKNKGEKMYESFSGFSLEKLSQDAGAFRRAAAHLAGIGTERLVVSYLHGVIPWSRFYIKDTTVGSITTSKPAFGMKDLYEILSTDFERVSSRTKRLWGAAPALRMDLELFKKSRTSSYGGLYTNFNRTQNEITLDGNTISIQDVIQPKDAAIRGQMQSARRISLVATPYLLRENIEQVLQEGKGPIHINWPVTNLNQLILK